MTWLKPLMTGKTSGPQRAKSALWHICSTPVQSRLITVFAASCQENGGPAIPYANCEESDQTPQMCSLNIVFTGCMCPKLLSCDMAPMDLISLFLGITAY